MPLASLRVFAIAACGLAALILIEPAYAQQPQATGLDALDDERVLTELANRGMDSLLEHAFIVNNVPQTKQHGIRTLTSLRRLTDPQEKLAAAERQQLISNVVKGIESALPSLNDPKLLMQQAAVLLAAGVEPDVNTLEYWGENPRTQAAINPVVSTVIRILERCAEVAQQRAEQIESRLRSPNDPLIEQYLELDQLANTATYTRHMVDYYLALSLDRTDPKRKQIADAAIAYLQEFDNHDSEVQPIVRNRIAKLQMVKGDFEAARKLFDSVAKVPNEEIEPGPDLAQQYEARYFAAVIELLDRKPKAARERWQALLKWQEQALPNDQETRDRVNAAAAMLEYRILSLESELAKGDAERRKANDAAVALLMRLVKDRPDLQGIIYEQVLTRLPENAPLSDLDPLLLGAIVRRGEQERLKPEGQAVDAAALERAIAAAQELISRRGKQGVDDSLAETSALLVPLFLEKLGRDVEAANAYLDFVQKFQSSRRAPAALEQAEVLIGQMRRTEAEDPQVVALLERFLPIAINEPFNKKEFAFQYAMRLTALGRYDEAVKYFRQVPEGENALAARFFEMVAIRELLATTPADSPTHAVMLRELQSLADTVTRGATLALTAADTDAKKQQARSLLVKTALLAADVSWRVQNDPKRTLQLLAKFEEDVRGLAGENELLSEALFLRVQSHMAAGNTNEATAALLQLLETRPGPQAGQIIYGLLEKLNQDLEQAQAAGDEKQIRTLTLNRAQLSTFLVDYAEKSSRPEARQQVYVYRRFSAITQYEAALLIGDEQKRQVELRRVLDLFRQLQSPENQQLYAATIDLASGLNPADPDPQVSFRIGLIAYELGEFAEAQKQLGMLLTTRKLGLPRIEQIDSNGVRRMVDNEQYWEAVLKLLRSNLVLGEAQEESARYLRQQYIRWGQHVGGQKWKGDFESLRAELLPDFTPPVLNASAAPSQSQ